MSGSRRGFLIRVGLRLIRFEPEFHNITITDLADRLSREEWPNYDATMDKVSVVLDEYLGLPNGDNATSIIQELHDYLETVPHGSNPLNWHYSFAIVITAVAFLTVAMRMWSKWVITRRLFMWEDVSMAVGMIMSIIITVLMWNSIHLGGGTYVYDVAPAKDIWEFMKCAFVCPFLYAVGVFAVKLSFVLFYQRLSSRPEFQIACKCTIAFLVLIFVSTFIASFFQCDPISTWTDPFRSNCFDVVAFWISYGSLNMVADVIIWLLPCWVVWRLPRPMKEKIQVMLLFGLGLACIVAAVGRVLTIENFVHDPDITTGEGPNGIYSLIEINVGIIVGCIPMCKALVSRTIQSRKSTVNSKTVNEIKKSGDSEETKNNSDKTPSEKGSEDNYEIEDEVPTRRHGDIESQKQTSVVDDGSRGIRNSEDQKPTPDSLGVSIDTLSAGTSRTEVDSEVPHVSLTSPYDGRKRGL